MVDRPNQPTEDSAATAEHIEEESRFDQLVADEERVLVDFYADWCGPCQMMAPRIDELAAENQAAIAKIDVEKLPQIASRYDVQAIPTFLVFHNEDVVDRLVGMQEKTALERTIE